MKRLIVHIQDPTTKFLDVIYENLSDTTIVRTVLPLHTMNELIACHSQVIMLGHGCSQGLFSNDYNLIINEQHVPALRQKKNNIYIWCHASTFFNTHRLQGFSTGMFISEPQEAEVCLHESYYSGTDVEQQLIEESNNVFAKCIREALELKSNVTGKEVFDYVQQNYNIDTHVVKFNKSVMCCRYDH